MSRGDDAVSALLFAELPRSRPRNRLMHVVDAGGDMILVECGHCGYSPGWQPWNCSRELTKHKRGVPCPECNAPSAPPNGSGHDLPEEEAVSETETTKKEIRNRMEDCGYGRHVGWWIEDHGLDHRSLLIEVSPHSVLFCCCEGERAERRINFVVDRETAVEIACALSKALADEAPSAGARDGG